jgi:predicted type IV restriction endonuclease
LKGSTARIKETPSFDGWARMKRQRLLQDGILVKTEDGDSYIFMKDVVFKSPSAAGATVTGRAVNGWMVWKDEEGNSLDKNLRK